MIYIALAIIVAILHCLFVVFVIAGGLLAYRWRHAIKVHFPVAVYGIAIMVFAWPCPLTRLEITLREQAGETVEWNAFLTHYVFSHIGLTGDEWFVLVAIIVVMVAFNYRPYCRFLWKR